MIEEIPNQDQIKFTIGPYQILDSIGKGGMGEVFLAYDPICGRRIAIKRIRPDLIGHKQMHRRFLREARITSQLTHPAIIPIYSIQIEKELAYYTMPFIEGKTLKDLLDTALQVEKQGVKSDQQSAIPSLIRIFLSICHAIAYAHSRGVIHRDIKPNNIIVGRYGEVLILDWGLAKLTKQADNGEAASSLNAEERAFPIDETKEEAKEETKVGKIVGTVAYLAPERAFGQEANFQSEIYSLGVILYQILTLHHPFHRRNLSEFRKNADKEEVIDPSVVAPYRDVPPMLSHITLKCLKRSLEERYQTVEQLSRAIESYLEGRSEWFKKSSLSIECKSDWEFQENVLTVEHMAISRGTDVSDWVFLMISRASFFGNTKIEARVRIGDKGHGIGFLMSIPEASNRDHPNNGYCLWISSDLHRSTRLLRANVEIISYPELFLQKQHTYKIKIERIDNNLSFYLDDLLQFSYTSHLPQNGSHIGLLTRDVDFTIEELNVFVGSQNITVNCLAVPDAFLAHRNYNSALAEYRRIALAFPGTAESREALFRAGMALLEEAKSLKDPMLKQNKCDEALEEFEKLRGTPGAPLEYLGKASVYQSLGEYEEEVKCFELAHRRYPHHPMLPILQEQLIYRMLDCSRHHRKATYAFVLLLLRHFPEAVTGHNIRKLFASLKKNWEPLYFIDTHNDIETFHDALFAIQLAFWLNKPYTLIEIIDDLLKATCPHVAMIKNALFCLIELDEGSLAKTKILEMVPHLQDDSFDLLLLAIQAAQEMQNGENEAMNSYLLAQLPEKLEIEESRIIIYLMEQAIIKKNISPISFLSNFKKRVNDSSCALLMDCYAIWGLLLKKEFKKAQQIFLEYSFNQITQGESLLFFLYGCWLFMTEGSNVATIHFSGVIDIPYPRSWTLFNHFFKSTPNEQKKLLEKAFFWEKKQLYLQQILFYDCIEDSDQADLYRKKISLVQ